RRSIPRRRRAFVTDRGGAADAADAGAGVHVEPDLAFEHQRAVDHRVRADHDPRHLPLAEADAEAVRLLHPQAAPDARAGADGDVAGHRLDAAPDVGVDQPDRAVDRADAAFHAPAAVDEDAAVDGLQVAADARVAAEVDAAVDGGDVAGGHFVAGIDAAVDGLHVAGAGAALQVDAAVDGAEVAVGLAGFRGDVAVDLVDVAAVLGERGRGQRDQGEEEQGSVHRVAPGPVAGHDGIDAGTGPKVYRPLQSGSPPAHQESPCPHPPPAPGPSCC